MKIIHHNDLDGRCSAAIAYRYLQGQNHNGEEIGLYEVDYDTPFPIDEIKQNEYVYILDFCLEKDDIIAKLLKTTKNIVWIDHHKTSLKKENLKHLDGIREASGKKSGCLLTWEYLHPGTPIPEAVLYISDMDAWTWEHKGKSMPFTTGLYAYKHDPSHPIWDRLIYDEKNAAWVQQVIDEGHICLRYRTELCKDYINQFGFETEFEGHKCFACGLYMFGSLVYGDKIDQYDMCISFEYNGEAWNIGLYSNNKIDVGEIAEKHEGGGHKGAAGFVAKELPFKKKGDKNG